MRTKSWTELPLFDSDFHTGQYLIPGMVGRSGPKKGRTTPCILRA